MLIQFLLNLLAPLNGSKTYLAALGLAGLAVFDATQGNYAGAVLAGFQALGLFGLRSALDNAVPGGLANLQAVLQQIVSLLSNLPSNSAGQTPPK
jgi:hypothetical protein